MRAEGAIKFWLQPVVHQGPFGKSETQGNPVSKGFAGAMATIPEVRGCLGWACTELGVVDEVDTQISQETLGNR